jgi:hypothetical protein
VLGLQACITPGKRRSGRKGEEKGEGGRRRNLTYSFTWMKVEDMLREKASHKRINTVHTPFI